METTHKAYPRPILAVKGGISEIRAALYVLIRINGPKAQVRYL